MSAPLTPHLEILPDAQRALWPELRDVPPGFVLDGGTGLALRLGHQHWRSRRPSPIHRS